MTTCDSVRGLHLHERGLLLNGRENIRCDIDRIGAEIREIGAAIYHDETPRDLIVTAQEIKAKAAELVRLAEKLRTQDSLLGDL